MADGAALIATGTTLAGVLVGGGLQMLQQRAGHHARREELAADRLWSARRDAYTQFLVAFNDVAHVAGNLAPRPGREVPSGAAAREVADYHFDRTVTPALRALQLVATPETTQLAIHAADALGAFRDRMTHPDLSAPTYRSDEYDEAYLPARQARLRFEACAAEDLQAF